MDVKSHAFEGEVAADAVGQGEGERRRADGRGKGATEDVDDRRIASLGGIGLHEVRCHQILASLGHDGEVLVLVERIQASTKHLLLEGNRVLLVSAGRTV